MSLRRIPASCRRAAAPLALAIPFHAAAPPAAAAEPHPAAPHTAGADTAATPLDVWYACRSPKASTRTDSTLDDAWARRYADAVSSASSRQAPVRKDRLAAEGGPDTARVRARLRSDPGLVLLCRSLVLQRGRYAGAPSPWTTWGSALRGQGPTKLPHAAELRQLAVEADSLRRELARVVRLARIETPAVEVVSALYFAPGKADFDPATQVENVRRLAATVRETLAASPGARVTIQGAADPTGSAQANDSLAKRRAMRAMLAVLEADNTIDRTRIDIADPHVPTKVAEDSGAVRAGTRRGVVTPAAAEQAGFTPETRTGLHYAGVLASPAAAVPGATAPLERSAAAPGARPGMTGFTVALTDVIIERAKADVEAEVVTRAVQAVCDTVAKPPTRPAGAPSAAWPPRTLVAPGFWIPQTCALFEVADTIARLPSLATFRSAVRTDLGAASARATEQLALAALQPRSAELRARGAAALALVRYVRALERGTAAPLALREAAAQLVSPVLGGDTTGADSTVARRVARALILGAAVADAYVTARAELPLWTTDSLVGGSPAPAVRGVADTLGLYAARAFAVNVADATVNDAFLRLVRGSPAVADARRLVAVLDSASSRLEALREAVEAARDVRQVTDAVRRERISAQLAAATSLVTGIAGAYLEDSTLVRTVARFEPPVRALREAVAGREYREALLAFVALADSLAANVPTRGDSATRAAIDRLRSPGVQRTFTLVADLAQAEREEDIRDALRGYVSAGAGFRAKRYGPDHTKFGLNSYLGGVGSVFTAAGDRRSSSGAFLPVGLELGWVRPQRRVAYRGVLLYPVDLGAVAALRFKGDANDPSTVRTRQLFAPGVAVLGSFGHTPVVFGATLQARPTTPQSGPGGYAGHAGLFLGADVPLVSIR